MINATCASMDTRRDHLRKRQRPGRAARPFCRHTALRSAGQQRSEKPLLIQFNLGRGNRFSPPHVSL